MILKEVRRWICKVKLFHLYKESFDVPHSPLRVLVDDPPDQTASDAVSQLLSEFVALLASQMEAFRESEGLADFLPLCHAKTHETFLHVKEGVHVISLDGGTVSVGVVVLGVVVKIEKGVHLCLTRSAMKFGFWCLMMFDDV